MDLTTFFVVLVVLILGMILGGAWVLLQVKIVEEGTDRTMEKRGVGRRLK